MTSTKDFPGAWPQPGIEPILDEMLADPLIHLVMQADGIDKADVKGIIRQTCDRLKALEKPIQLAMEVRMIVLRGHDSSVIVVKRKGAAAVSEDTETGGAITALACNQADQGRR